MYVILSLDANFSAFFHEHFVIGMGLGRIFLAQGQFGPISFGPAQGLGHFWNLTFGPGPGLDFLALGWAGPWARLKINVGPNLGHFDPKI